MKYSTKKEQFQYRKNVAAFYGITERGFVLLLDGFIEKKRRYSALSLFFFLNTYANAHHDISLLRKDGKENIAALLEDALDKSDNLDYFKKIEEDEEARLTSFYGFYKKQRFSVKADSIEYARVHNAMGIYFLLTQFITHDIIEYLKGAKNKLADTLVYELAFPKTYKNTFITKKEAEAGWNKRLAEVRENRNMKKRDVADEMGIIESQYWHYEDGQSKKITKLLNQRLEKVFNKKEINYIYYGDKK